MSTVVALPGKGPINPTAGLGPVDGLVKALEGYLEQAKRGEIRAMGFAIVKDNGECGTAWEQHPDEGISHQLMAAMTYLQNRYANHRNNVPGMV